MGWVPSYQDDDQAFLTHKSDFRVRDPYKFNFSNCEWHENGLKLVYCETKWHEREGGFHVITFGKRENSKKNLKKSRLSPPQIPNISEVRTRDHNRACP